VEKIQRKPDCEPRKKKKKRGLNSLRVTKGRVESNDGGKEGCV